MSTLFRICVAGLLLVCMAACSKNGANEDPDVKQFKGKTVEELLEYLHTQYGCYTKYQIIPEITLGTLIQYYFLYYDSVEVKKIWVEIEPHHLRHVPQRVPLKEFWKPIDHLFPLYLYKKERIERIGMEVMPLQEWLDYEIYLDSLERVGMRMSIEQELEEQAATQDSIQQRQK